MKTSKKKVWQGLSAVTASLLSLCICITTVANNYSGKINATLGTSNYKIEKMEGEEEADGDYYKSEFDSLEELVKAKEALAEEIGSEGAVLLKNENAALPIAKESENVTVWGLNSLQPTLGGLIGSSITVTADAGQKQYGIYEALEEKGYTINGQMKEFYQSETCQPYYRKAAFFGQEVPGHSLVPNFSSMYETATSYNIGEAPANLYSEQVLVSAKDTTAVVLLSRDSSEAADYSTTMKAEGDDEFDAPLALSNYEREMINLAKENSNGKVVVLLNTDVPMEIEELKQDADIDAILWIGLPGAYGFLGVADILSGDINPSGHIGDTYASNSTSSPAMVNFGINLYTNNSTAGAAAQLAEGDKADWFLVENEGIYIGYKYYETRYEDLVLGNGGADATAGSSTGNAWNYAEEVTYPFGYGLSYTTFEQKLKNLEVNVGDTGKAEVEVTNTGDVEGKSVVQLYVQTPYTEGGIEKAAVQLLDYGKTKTLQPGESETVTIEFDPEYMASYDETQEKENGTVGAWVLDEGNYLFTVGNGAHEALNNILAKKTGNETDLVKTAETEMINPDNVVEVSLQKDIETYSVDVANSLQSADINKQIPDTVEYMTRSDWSKGWERVSEITPTEEMMVGLTNQLTALTENGDGVTWGAENGLKITDMLEFDQEGNLTGVIPLDDPRWDQLIEQIDLEEALTAMELMGDDFEPIPSIGLPVVVSADSPIGMVYDQVAGYAAKWNESNSEEATYVSEDEDYAAYSMALMPTEPVVAATFNKELIKREGELMGEDSLWSNVSLIQAPGLNLHRTPYCSRNHEYYSEDPVLTGFMGTAFSAGAEAKGLIAQVKHFAFNHQESNRAGLSTFFSEQGGRENELRGFQIALKDNTATSVMTAFNRIGTEFSGASKGLLEQILREEWDYEGFVYTDMVSSPDYMNWRDTIFNGGGCLLAQSIDVYENSKLGSPSASTKNIDIIEKDTKFQQAMQQTLKYYIHGLADSNAVNGVLANTKTVYVRTWWQNTLVGIDVGMGVLVLLSLALYVKAIAARKRKVGEHNEE